MSDDDRGTAADWLWSDKHRKLLPTPWLTPYEFEEFVERLLAGERHLGSQVRHVVKVERWGTTGDAQDGVDLVGEFSDGRRAAWQCKHLEKLPPSEVREAVNAATYVGAREFYLVFTRIASSPARAEMKKHPGWTLLDRAQLTRMLHELPPQIQRDIVEEAWGEEVRRLFIGAPGDAFESVQRFASARRNPDAPMNDISPLVGRDAELTALRRAFDRQHAGFPQVVVVSGPGGRGKSRLVTDALLALQDRQPDVPVVCLSSGRRFDALAMSELWIGPQVVLVDDANRDPAALAPLLAFARARPDVQLVLATRPSATSAVIEQVVRAQFAPGNLKKIDVGLLTRGQARQLVRSLAAQLDLPFPLIRYLAGQAEHSPFVAVIAVNLIRRGELTKAMAVDDGLRELILNRYDEVLGVDVQDFGHKITERALATYAALGRVSAADPVSEQQIADFCGLPLIELARVVDVLRDRGVLIEHAGQLQVVPDALADHVLEITAAYKNYDSGFVAELWDTFGATHHHELALTLGELDWRLSRRDGPSVMDTVWTAIRLRLETPYYGSLVKELEQLDQLAATQPYKLVPALEQLRLRLAGEDAEGAIGAEDDEDQAAQMRRLLGLSPLDRDDVRATMPKLYVRAAANAPELLETVLDALWDLGRHDTRPANAVGQSRRMVTDRLANLATLPDSSFPERIVRRIAEWLRAEERPDDLVTPLFALKPLLAKEELETVQAGARELGFRSHTFSASNLREVRDQIRETLHEQALSSNLRRAGAALDLLGEALRPPHGYFSQTVGNEAILQWENDDLSTIGVLSQITDATDLAGVRRRVRHHVSWTAKHAVSLRLRQGALKLVTHLDDLATIADDVADLAWNEHLGPAVFRGREVPTVGELQAERERETDRLATMTDEERQADRRQRIDQQVEARMSRQAEELAELAGRLLDHGDIPRLLDMLDRTARDIEELKPGKRVSYAALWRRIAEQSAERLAPMVHAVSWRRPGPLDHDLNVLIDAWLDIAREDCAAWLRQEVHTSRPEVKLAIAAGFAGQRWYSFGDSLAEIWTAGADDSDPEISQAFLATSGGYLRAAPVSGVEFLLDHGIEQYAATRALEDACNYDGRTFGASLGSDQANAVLRLVTQADLTSYIVEETVGGIADTQPSLVLSYLSDRADGVGGAAVRSMQIDTELDPRALAVWVESNLHTAHAAAAVATAIKGQLGADQAEALIPIARELNANDLHQLVTVLAALDIWPLEQPKLAESVVRRARETATSDQVRAMVKGAMVPSHWSGVDGISDELNTAVDWARSAVAQTVDQDLKADYVESLGLIQHRIDAERMEYEDDDEIGW